MSSPSAAATTANETIRGPKKARTECRDQRKNQFKKCVLLGVKGKEHYKHRLNSKTGGFKWKAECIADTWLGAGGLPDFKEQMAHPPVGPCSLTPEKGFSSCLLHITHVP